MILESAVFGREGYTISPQDGRFITVPLIGVVIGGVTKIDPSVGFANNPWGGEYGVLRDLYNFKNAISGNATLSDQQKAGLLGLAQTFDGLMMFELVQAHDTLGAITEIKADASVLAPFSLDEHTPMVSLHMAKWGWSERWRYYATTCDALSRCLAVRPLIN